MPVKKVLETIRRERLIEKGERILVAFSGGADSVSLLAILKGLEDELDIEVFAAHLNHQIRSVEAHEDALFSYRTSRSIGVPCFLRSINIPLLAKEGKMTIEEAARSARYQMFFELKEKLGIDKIAVAHNMDDQAETILMRIMRGTGLNGLKGMDYKRKDGVIRPLLDVKRYEIEDYCRLNNISYQTDKTNFENEYTRNKIRLDLFPFIEEEFACNIKEALSRMANGLREDSTYLEDLSHTIFKENAQEIEDYAISFELDALESIDPSIVKRLLKISYAQLTGSAEGLESIHLDEGMKIIKSSKQDLMTNFPKGIIAEKKGYNFYVSKKPIEEEKITFEYILDMNGITMIPELSIEIDARIMSKAKCKLMSSGSSIKSFDLDKIKGDLVVRNRHAGDRIRPLGFSGTKKLKDLFIDKKVPKSMRERIPIFVDDEKVIWVLGHEISEESKIDEDTKKVVRLTVRPIAKNDLQQEEK